MIQLIGIIVSVYALARLVQIPLQTSVAAAGRKDAIGSAGVITLVSIIGGLIIAACAIALLKVEMPSLADPAENVTGDPWPGNHEATLKRIEALAPEKTPPN